MYVNHFSYYFMEFVINFQFICIPRKLKGITEVIFILLIYFLIVLADPSNTSLSCF